jgi:hypothetical protein
MLDDLAVDQTHLFFELVFLVIGEVLNEVTRMLPSRPFIIVDEVGKYPTTQMLDLELVHPLNAANDTLHMVRIHCMRTESKDFVNQLTRIPNPMLN